MKRILILTLTDSLITAAPSGGTPAGEIVAAVVAALTVAAVVAYVFGRKK